jgi:hypothetical protein
MAPMWFSPISAIVASLKSRMPFGARPSFRNS